MFSSHRKRNKRTINNILYMYVFTQPLCLEQDASQDPFLSEIKLVWIQTFTGLSVGIRIRWLYSLQSWK